MRRIDSQGRHQPATKAASGGAAQEPEPSDLAIKRIEDAVTAAAVDPRQVPFDRRVTLLIKCTEALSLEPDDLYPPDEIDADGKDPKVIAALEAHRVTFKRLSPSQKADYWDALRMVKRRPHLTKTERWNEALAELRDIQVDCEAYAEVPESLKDEDREERYRTIAEMDLSELESAEF